SGIDPTSSTCGSSRKPVQKRLSCLDLKDVPIPDRQAPSRDLRVKELFVALVDRAIAAVVGEDDNCPWPHVWRPPGAPLALQEGCRVPGRLMLNHEPNTRIVEPDLKGCCRHNQVCTAVDA